MSAPEAALLEAARQAYANSYARYTDRTIGAALLGANGKTYIGCTVEIASFAGSLCAESVAIASAVADGEKQFSAIAIYPAVPPCGTCRQMMVEFNPKLTILYDKNGAIERQSVSELLPHHFGPENLQ